MGKTIEGVIVTSQMPKGVLNMSLTPSQGTHTFDPVTKVGGWAFESPSTQAGSLVGRQDQSKGLGPKDLRQGVLCGTLPTVRGG